MPLKIKKSNQTGTRERFHFFDKTPQQINKKKTNNLVEKGKEYRGSV